MAGRPLGDRVIFGARLASFKYDERVGLLGRPARTEERRVHHAHEGTRFDRLAGGTRLRPPKPWRTNREARDRRAHLRLCLDVNAERQRAHSRTRRSPSNRPSSRGAADLVGKKVAWTTMWRITWTATGRRSRRAPVQANECHFPRSAKAASRWTRRGCRRRSSGRAQTRRNAPGLRCERAQSRSASDLDRLENGVKGLGAKDSATRKAVGTLGRAPGAGLQERARS